MKINEKKSNRETKMIHFCRYSIPMLYSGVFLIMVILVFCNIIMDEKVKNFGWFGGYQVIDDDWRDTNGNIVALKEQGTNTKKDIIMFYQLPVRMESQQTIVFRSVNAFAEAWIDDEKVYEMDVTKGPFYNVSPGSRWNMFGVKKKDSGKIIKLIVKPSYNDRHCKVYNFYIGDQTAIILKLIQDKMVPVFFCIIIFFMGLFFLVVAQGLNAHKSVKDRGLVYLSFISIFAALWCFIETNIVQFFYPNVRMIQLIGNMLLILAVVPIILYMDSAYKVLKVRIVRIMLILNIIYIIICIVVHLLKIKDFYQMLQGSIITLGLIIMMLVFAALYNKNHEKNNISVRLNTIGIISLEIGIMIDWFRFLFLDVLDRAFFVRISLLIFVLCFGFSSLIKIQVIADQVKKSDLIAKLAYMDGLTEIGNRTAYMEKLEEIIQGNDSTCFYSILFDINNLKLTNDNFGHQAGDRLIKISVKMIKEVFESIGKIYRIGGDEFILISQSINCEKIYSIASGEFQRKMIEYNENHNEVFFVSVAFGGAGCKTINKENVEKVEKIADDNMYHMKREMKDKPNCYINKIFFDIIKE